jgi:predicted nucleic acid-binding protein
VAALFFDPRALVKRYIFETGTTWVQRQTDPSVGHKLLLSALAGPEMIATLVRRARSDRQLARHLPRLLALFRLDWAASYAVTDIDAPVIAESMRLAESHGLRGADAVHLAVALDGVALHRQTGTLKGRADEAIGPGDGLYFTP